MKVKLVKFINFEITHDLTIGKVYDVDYVDNDGDVWIIDDAGDENNLYVGEFEVIEE